MTAAIVAPAPRGSWDESTLIVRRFANALACHLDVDLLIPHSTDAVELEGAITVRRFRSTISSPDRLDLLLELVLGPSPARRAPTCACADEVLTAAAQALPSEVQRELVEAGGERSPGLLEHLATASYDLVVLCDYAAPVVHDALCVLPDGVPVILLPLAAPSPFLDFSVHDQVFDRAQAIVIATEGERARLLSRSTSPATPLRDLRFVLRVHDLVWKNEPLTFDRDVPTVVIPRAWRTGPQTSALIDLARDLEERFDGGLRVKLVGPGWKLLPGDLHGPFAESRFDVWRWACRALAVLDPDPGKLLAREALESMMYGTPIVTPFAAGAALEHAQAGSAGLWYRTDDELEVVLRAMLDQGIRRPLGEQAQEYADATYRDTEAYIKGVGQLVEELGAVP